MSTIQNVYEGQYSRITVQINGTTLVEEADVTIERATNAIDVFTVQKGYAGQSPGAGMSHFTITSVIPSTYVEFDPGIFMVGMTGTQAGTRIDLVLSMGFNSTNTSAFQSETTGFADSTNTMAQLNTKADVISDTVSHGVKGEAKWVFKCQSGPVQWTAQAGNWATTGANSTPS